MQKNIASYLLSFSLVCLAVAIAFFAIQISQFRAELPELAGQIERTSQAVKPLLAEVSEIRQEIPSILSEIEKTRELIPSIVDQVDATNRNVPIIVEEVHQVRELVPDLLLSVNEISATVTEVSKIVQEIKPLVPVVLAEVKQTRKSIPPILDDVAALMDKADSVGQKTSEGAVTGVVTGVIKAPFKLLGGLFGKGLPAGADKFDTSDLEKIYLALSKLDASPNLGTTSWSNPATGKKGTLAIKKSYKSGGLSCHLIDYSFFERDIKIGRDSVALCKTENGDWELQP